MPATFITTADPCDREAAWLSAPGTSSDGLPSLLIDYGGPWQAIQAYQPRTPANRTSQIFVLRSFTQLERWANVRTIAGYDFTLKLRWPLANQMGDAESDQRAFDVAINALVMRIRGVGPNRPGGADKTHGGAFLQVAEGSPVSRTASGIRVQYVDPELTMAENADFRATVSYAADDPDFND